jgi:hypothetical protein
MTPAEAFYEPAIPMRWIIRKRGAWSSETRGGSIVYGVKSTKYMESYKVLQVWIEPEWVDVPEVEEEP